MMKLWDKLVKGVNPDEDPMDNDIFEDDELYGSGDNSFGNGDISDFMSNGAGYSPYANQNQGGGVPQNQPQSQPGGYQPAPQPVSTGGISVAGSSNMQLSVELKVVKPEEYQRLEDIAELLINRKTVILNLEETNKEMARRLIDFLRGVAYAIQGQVERVSERTFVITPSNISIDASQIKEARRKSSGSSADNSIY